MNSAEDYTYRYLETDDLEHDRPLQGQSPYLVNAGLFYQSPKLGLTQ